MTHESDANHAPVHGDYYRGSMLNSELAEAIEDAWSMTQKTERASSVYRDVNAHLSRLLEVQQARAACVIVDKPVLTRNENNE